jgi:hypothetical protein
VIRADDYQDPFSRHQLLHPIQSMLEHGTAADD